MLRSKNPLLAVAVAAVVAGLALAPARAEAKSKLTAKINGKRFRANLGPVTGAYAAGGFNLAANARHGLRVDNLTFTCSGTDVATATLPVTIEGCGGTYAIGKLGAPPKGWGGDHVMTFVVKSFKNGAIKGTFSGTMPPGDSNPSDPPAAFTKGVFAAQLH